MKDLAQADEIVASPQPGPERRIGIYVALADAGASAA